jgi:hypothetical protein
VFVGDNTNKGGKAILAIERAKAAAYREAGHLTGGFHIRP